MIAVATDELWYRELLACPDCGADVESRKGVACTECGFSDLSGRDLRTRGRRPLSVSFPRLPAVDVATILSEIELTRPRLTYDGPPAVRDSREFMSVISSILPARRRVLDLGCGPRDQSVPINHLGHSYVGFDFSNQNADFLADAHSIPFKASSFDCVFSYAVFEHLHNPFVAIQEVSRVLKPGGIFLGAVSQGEPFHQSYFHFTPWGLISLVSSVPSLRIVRLWPSMDTLQSLSRMGRYPRVVRFMLKQVDALHRSFPILAPRRIKWGARDKVLDELYRAGSLCFCISKDVACGEFRG